MFNLIKTLLQDYFQLLKKPNPNPRHKKIKGRRKWQILLFSFLLDFLLTTPFVLILYLISEYSNLNLDNHAVGAVTNEYSLSILILFGGVIMPFIEELIFRLPLNYKRNYLFKFAGFIIGKNKVKNFWLKYYTVFFYLSIITFGLIHISNYKDDTLAIFSLAPILVLPQLIGGTILSYLRIKLGFIWGFLNHALFNSTLFLFAFVFNVEEQVNIENENFYLKVEVAESRYGNKEQLNIRTTQNSISMVNTEYAQFNQIAKKMNWDTVDSKQNKRQFNIEFRTRNTQLDGDSVLHHHLRKLVDSQYEK